MKTTHIERRNINT